MSDNLLTYYNRELTWFMRALAEFSDAHPKAARNLRISEDAVEDPHISRLIESVALLNARIQNKLDDDFPRVVGTVLEHLYPYYLAPKPSMLIAQMHAIKGLDDASEVPAGTLFDTEDVDGVACRFETRYPVTLTPLSVASASLQGKPFNTPGSDKAKGANAVLELQFDNNSKGFNFADAELDTIAMHLRPDQNSWRLYDLLYKHVLKIVIAKSDLDPDPTVLEPEYLSPKGFNNDELVLPNIGDTESDYQLITEFFTYTEKFLFFELSGLQQALDEHKDGFAVYIYLSDSHRDLETTLNEGAFALHATPMLNLFETETEPMQVQPEIAEYDVIPDIRAVGDTEVYAITSVSLVDDGASTSNVVPPYFGFRHDASQFPAYWHGTRRDSISGGSSKGRQTDYFLSLSTLDGQSLENKRQTLQISALCSNGNLPSKLPFGGGQPRLRPLDAVGGIADASTIGPPTTPRRHDLGHGALWRLLSHLNLNYLSLVGAKDSAEQLREMLRLYDHGDSPSVRSQINSLDRIKTQIISLPMSIDGRPVICRGIDAEVTFDAAILDSGSALLFGSILKHFLSMYVNLNSFVRLSVRIKGREGIYHRWEPMVGNRSVL